MCRLLFVRYDKPFEVRQHLEQFAQIARGSKEFQGHGWGCSYLENGEWQHYKNIRPIWDDDLTQFGATTQILAHARSAFQDKDIRIENNMPFHDHKYVFIFNGELRGVKIRETGRIGAEKIFNFIKRFDRGDMRRALQRGVEIIKRRTEHVKAMNIIISDKSKAYVASGFTSDPGYFTLHFKRSNGELIICSEAYPDEQDWVEISNHSIQVFSDTC